MPLFKSFISGIMKVAMIVPRVRLLSKDSGRASQPADVIP